MYQIVISFQFFKMAYEGLTKMPNFLPFCSISAPCCRSLVPRFDKCSSCIAKFLKPNLLL
ncbi:hypothetical protein HanRHA438_Chr01g0036931 [Helianthus annuus]|uniref:Uncharacterized protein n=1 Tax=Helianthus annuus TaxID=4232 RepID=A0A251VQT8_HELAN|nr:hypothetical protein HanXRQr2_Chr01g0036041 [Helianthus annuus]KAJ0627958.1 hypothetical protein HanHA89_Chr01g0031551 [Helianthus annuus]KAJ0949276.1 hypothetical protein HanRHA438_Chr01g0036931 [Helianthus annuus]